MKRILIVPAAGRGTRLGYDKPKFLYPLCGKALIDHVLQSHHNYIDEAVIVVSPDALELAQAYFQNATMPITVVVQEKATGMLDAILKAEATLIQRQPDRIWITWCDQVAIRDETLNRMAAMEQENESEMIVPILRKTSPYIHFETNEQGNISAVLQRREGDNMPEVGNNDMGLFSLSYAAFEQLKTAYSASLELGDGTGERNFLPFVPWLALRDTVLSMNGTDEVETLGVNTIADADELGQCLCG